MMRFKQYLKIGLVTAISYISTNYAQEQDTLRFDGVGMDKYRVGNYLPVDFNNDNEPDYLVGAYDLDENGVADVGAWFKINRYWRQGDRYYFNSNRFAKMVGFDNDEDGSIDEYIIDMDNNTTLESRVKSNKEVKVMKS